MADPSKYTLDRIADEAAFDSVLNYFFTETKTAHLKVNDSLECLIVVSNMPMDQIEHLVANSAFIIRLSLVPYVITILDFCQHRALLSCYRYVAITKNHTTFVMMENTNWDLTSELSLSINVNDVGIMMLNALHRLVTDDFAKSLPVSAPKSSTEPKLNPFPISLCMVGLIIISVGTCIHLIRKRE
jgi:hypothetical protein